MKWIGLTGGIATGKSAVSHILRDLGLNVIDADELARRAVQKNSPGLKAVIDEFGLEFLTEKNELNRDKIGKIIFSNLDKRKKLEDILHPLIQELRAYERRQLEQSGCEVAFYDVPLLFEKKLQDDFDSVILVYATPQEQKTRMKIRDNLSEQEIESRINAQMPIDDKVKLADYVIFNHGQLADLKNNVQTVLNELGLK